MHLQFKQNSEIVLPHARNNAGDNMLPLVRWLPQDSLWKP